MRRGTCSCFGVIARSPRRSRRPVPHSDRLPRSRPYGQAWLGHDRWGSCRGVSEAFERRKMNRRIDTLADTLALLRTHRLPMLAPKGMTVADLRHLRAPRPESVEGLRRRRDAA